MSSRSHSRCASVRGAAVFALLTMVLTAALLIQALEPLRASADGTADEADLHFRLGNEAYRAGDFSEALEHYLASNRLVPNHNVVFNIARAYQRLEMFPEAYRYYASALGRDRRGGAHAHRGVAHGAGRPGGAHRRGVHTFGRHGVRGPHRSRLGGHGARAPSRCRPGRTASSRACRVTTTRPASRVRVAVGQRVSVRLALTRIVGTLVVRATKAPSCAWMARTGRGSARCPARCPWPLGSTSSTCARPATSRWRAPWPSPRAETTRTDISLVAETGSVVVRSDVEGALVQIDGVAVGFTPRGGLGHRGGRRARARQRARLRARRSRGGGDHRPAGGAHQCAHAHPARGERRVPRGGEHRGRARVRVGHLGAEIEAFRYPTLAEALRGQRGFALTSDSTYSNAGVRGSDSPTTTTTAC
jgi:outer membrane receptor for ferrienterochelin and colicins